MTEPGATIPPALGLKRLYGDAFAIFLRNLPLFLVIGLFPLLAATFVHELAVLKLNRDYYQDEYYPTTFEFYLSYYKPWYLAVFIGVYGSYCFFAGLVLAVGCAIAQGEPVRIGAMAGGVMRVFLPLFAYSILVQLLYTVAFFFLIVPAFYVAARYACLYPAVIVERAGWDGWTRAVDLSKGYRWPIVLLYLPFSLFALAEWAWYTYFPGEEYVTVSDAFYGTVTTTFSFLVTVIFPFILTALVYFRLLEIKQGHTNATIERVFE